MSEVIYAGTYVVTEKLKWKTKEVYKQKSKQKSPLERKNRKGNKLTVRRSVNT